MVNHDSTRSPLRPAVFHILLSLAQEARHGLGIAQEVEEGGGPRLGPGTLYRSLKEMVEAGLIEEVAAPSGDADPRRRVYAITHPGHAALTAEADRYAGIVELARRRLVLPEPR